MIMKHHKIKKINGIFPDEKQAFFDTQAVETANAVVPLAQIKNENHIAGRRFRIPVFAANKSFNSLTLALILLSVTVVFGGLGAAVFYKLQASSASSEVAPEPNEIIIQAEQTDIKKPSAEIPAPAFSKSSYAAPKEVSVEETASPESSDAKDSLPIEVIFDDDKPKIDDDEDAPEIRRERKKNKKTEKIERKIKRGEKQIRELEKILRVIDDNK